jgi:hypothetical protein
VLVGAALDRALADQRAHRLRVARHPAAEDALHLQRLLVRQPRAPVLEPELGRLEVRLPVHPLVRLRDGEPQRPPLVLEELELEPGLLGDLACRVARLGLQQSLDREQGEAVLRRRAAQLLDRHAVAVELVEQGAPRSQRAVVGAAVEQALGFPVHRADGTARLIESRRFGHRHLPAA